MSKSELELKKLDVSSEKFGAVVNLIQHVITSGTVLGGLYISFAGLVELTHSSPGTLTELAAFVEKLNLATILSYTLAGMSVLGYAYERTGKKRAIKKLDKLRKQLEAGDSYKSSSQLDENGHTPR